MRTREGSRANGEPNKCEGGKLEGNGEPKNGTQDEVEVRGSGCCRGPGDAEMRHGTGWDGAGEAVREE